MVFRFSCLIFLLLMSIVLSLSFGSVWFSPSELWSSGILELRLNRTIAGIFVGAGLAVSGALFQGILRNPMADPYVLGISGGAGLFSAAAMLLGWGLFGAFCVSLSSFAGALGTIVLVYALARERSGVVHAYTLLLVGIMINAIAGSLLVFLFSVAPANRLPGILWQLMGSLQIFNQTLLWTSGLVIMIGLGISLILAPFLNPLFLGDEKAATLGLNPNRVRKAVFFTGSMITGACVSLCGMIGFVGLMVPHIVRNWLGNDNRLLIPGCALAGAAFLPLADPVARTVLAPWSGAELPVGAITALLGAPFFIVLMGRRR